MTCNLKEKFKAAEAAIRVAFDAALEHQDDFDNTETVTDIWHMYSNWRRTIKSVPDLPEHSHDTTDNINVPYSFGVDTTLPDGCYDPDHNISIDTAGIADNTTTFAPPNGDWGEYMSTGDMITFTNENSTGTVGIPAQPQVTKAVDPEQNAADLNDRDGV